MDKKIARWLFIYVYGIINFFIYVYGIINFFIYVCFSYIYKNMKRIKIKNLYTKNILCIIIMSMELLLFVEMNIIIIYIF